MAAWYKPDGEYVWILSWDEYEQGLPPSRYPMSEAGVIGLKHAPKVVEPPAVPQQEELTLG